MSPVARSGRKVTLLIGMALFLALFAVPALAQDSNGTAGGDGNVTEPADGNATTPDDGTTGAASGDGIPADAPAPAEGGITRILTFGVIEENCPGGAPAPCWDVLNLVANPGDTVVLRGDLRNSGGFHNVHIIEPGAAVAADAPGPKTQIAPEELHVVSYLVPDDGELTFICDAHPDTMVGHVITPAAALEAGGAHESVPGLGVNFLAYWVGVIAFAILFIVYGLTFFLFKYNETRTTTDHFDRAEGDGSKRLAAAAPLLAVVLGIVAIAAVIFVATR